MKEIDVTVKMTNRRRGKDDPDEIVETSTILLLNEEVRGMIASCVPDNASIDAKGFPSSLQNPSAQSVAKILAWADVQNFFRDVVLHIAFQNLVKKAVCFAKTFDAGSRKSASEWIRLKNYVPSGDKT